MNAPVPDPDLTQPDPNGGVELTDSEWAAFRGKGAPTAPDRLAQIEARLAAATPGPWLKDSDEPYIVMKPDRPGSDWDGKEVARVLRDDYGLFEEADAELIAHAPADLAALVKFARAVEDAEHKWRRRHTDLERLRGAVDQDDTRFRTEVLAARRALDAL